MAKVGPALDASSKDGHYGNPIIRDGLAMVTRPDARARPSGAALAWRRGRRAVGEAQPRRCPGASRFMPSVATAPAAAFQSRPPRFKADTKIFNLLIWDPAGLMAPLSFD